MTNLITEARELCERATPGPWGSRIDVGKTYYVFTPSYGVRDFCCLSGGFEHEADAAFIARSHTIIPELCDALEKATAKNDELIRELSELARESVKRDVALAKLEAEVAAAVGEGCEYCLSTWPDRAADGFGDIWHGNKLSVGYGVYREIGYCPMCGKRLEGKLDSRQQPQ